MGMHISMDSLSLEGLVLVSSFCHVNKFRGQVSEENGRLNLF